MSKEIKECNCLETVTKKIEEKIIESESNKFNGYKLVEANWEHRSWYPKVRLYSNFIAKGTFKKKDGTESKPKNCHVAIYYTFCPFCGTKYPDSK